MRIEAPITAIRAAAYTIPTDKPEADGTFAWERTTMVLVEVEAAGVTGIGFTYAAAVATALVEGPLAEALKGAEAFDLPTAFRRMQEAVRNMGRPGIAMTAISAVDLAMWDLKAKLLDLPLATLLGRARDDVPIYGSGGFTSYDDRTLQAQLAGWVERDGCRAVKMKIGTEPALDPARVEAAKAAIGEAALLVDANGAYSAKEAIAMAKRFGDQDVRWFEEPVSSADLEGLALVRAHAPAPIEVAAGEYAWVVDDVRRMLEAKAVDVQQADATRCGGITGFLQAGALCDAFHIDLSGHCAPAMHLHVACAVPKLRHLEWFHDHVRIEAMLFDGAPVPRDGRIAPDLARPGHGLTFKAADAARYAV